MDGHFHKSQAWCIPDEHLRLEENALGTGSFKVVYKGSYLGTPVAVAQLKTTVSSDTFGSLENEVQSEVKILQTLRHPNTLLFMGVSFKESTGQFSIITELAPLGDLKGLIRRHKIDGPLLQWGTKIQMCREIAAALRYLHSNKIAHLDLKPENILVFGKSGSDYLLKIADFGLGQLVKTKLIEEPRGTPWIMAPEMFNTGSFDPFLADIFSFGFVLVDILTDGRGEVIRDDEVSYQKKDPLTGKFIKPLAFGVNTMKLFEIVDEIVHCPDCLKRLTCECCDENPSIRPSLEDVARSLDSLSEIFGVIKSDVGADCWMRNSSNAFVGCVRLVETTVPMADKLSVVEQAVLKKLLMVQGTGETASTTVFSTWWEKLSPLIGLLEDPQVGWMWQNGCAPLFVSREQTETAISDLGRNSVIIRLCSEPGKLVASYFAEDRFFHRTLKLENGLEDDLISLAGIFGNQAVLVSRDCKKTVMLSSVHKAMPVKLVAHHSYFDLSQKRASVMVSSMCNKCQHTASQVCSACKHATYCSDNCLCVRIAKGLSV
jgi:hypothetical protein